MSVWHTIPIAAGLGLLILLWRLLNPPPRLVVGERGILQRGLGWGWIHWDEIEGAYPPSLREADTLRLRLHVSERLARILRRRRRLAANTPVEDSMELRLSLAGSDFNAVELLQEILAHRPAEGPQPGVGAEAIEPIERAAG
jgi:hypothetical protein